VVNGGDQAGRKGALRALVYPVFRPKTGDRALMVFQPKKS